MALTEIISGCFRLVFKQGYRKDGRWN